MSGCMKDSLDCKMDLQTLQAYNLDLMANKTAMPMENVGNKETFHLENLESQDLATSSETFQIQIVHLARNSVQVSYHFVH